MRLADVHVVLLRPRGAANLGSIARALKNCGMHRLTLVEPRLGSWFEAWMMAVHAHDVLREAESMPKLAPALVDARWIVGTTIRPLPGQRLLTPRQVAAEAAVRGPPTLLFGDEEAGLRSVEIARCHDVSIIPGSPLQPSFNLAQAVMIYCYELFAAHGEAQATPAPPPVERADEGAVAHVEDALRARLEATGFADVDRPRHGITELMQPLRRAGLTDLEARLWTAALQRARPR
jgi:TrmH family RNA methyltransferase